MRKEKKIKKNGKKKEGKRKKKRKKKEEKREEKKLFLFQENQKYGYTVSRRSAKRERRANGS